MKPTTTAINDARRELQILGSAGTTDYYEPSARTIALAALAIAGMNHSIAPQRYGYAAYELEKYSAGWDPFTRDLVQRTVWQQRDERSWFGIGTHRYENVEKAIEILKRAASLLHYHREIAPGWTDTRQIRYADNSIEQEQVDRHGNLRRKMVLAPGGDVCY